MLPIKSCSSMGSIMMLHSQQFVDSAISDRLNICVSLIYQITTFQILY